MDQSLDTPLRIGSWEVNPLAGHIACGTQVVRVDARSMRLLLYLAERAGQTVSIDELLEHVWAGVVVTSDSVYQAVASLRRLLGDEPKRPTYIVTVPRLGYRMVATVTRPASLEKSEAAIGLHPAPEVVSTVRSQRALAAGVAGAVTIIAALLAWLLVTHQPGASGTSVAVLPFLDLSESMDQEPLADGITETLIARLSSRATLQVASLRDSLYWKGRQPMLAEAAEALNVSYVLDGSVRTSGGNVEINAQLVKAETGYIVWSRAYRDSSDQLQRIQDSIAAEVAQALDPHAT